MPVPACGSRYAREGAPSEAEPARGRRGPSSEAEHTRGGLSPRARRNPLEGALASSEANPLKGAFDWATPVGRGGHRSAGRALRACLGKRCILLFLQVLSRIPPVS
jgi:hypothetical protein